MLHTETSDGTEVPIWEEVKPEDVVVLKDVMTSRRDASNSPLHYNRIPITAEKAPDYSDLKDLIEVVLRAPPNTPIVVNCQLGRGRSTLASVRASQYEHTWNTLMCDDVHRLSSYSYVNGCKFTAQRHLAHL